MVLPWQNLNIFTFTDRRHCSWSNLTFPAVTQPFLKIFLLSTIILLSTFGHSFLYSCSFWSFFQAPGSSIPSSSISSTWPSHYQSYSLHICNNIDLLKLFAILLFVWIFKILFTKLQIKHFPNLTSFPQQ